MALPQGWATAPLETMLDYEQPQKYIVRSVAYSETYPTPVLTAGKSFIIGHTDETDGIYSEGLPVIIFDDFTTSSQFVTFPFKVKSSAMKILQAALPELDIKYLFYRMQLIHHNVTTHKRYWISDYSKITIEVAPLAEQHRIVAKIDALFSELDKGVEVLQTVRQQLRTYRQAVLKWAFEGKLTEEWRKTHMFSKEFINEAFMSSAQKECNRINACGIDTEFPIYDIPNDWTWISVGSLSKGIEYGTSAKSEKSGKVVVLRMGNIQNCSLVYDDLAYSNDDAEIQKYMLKKNDVLFNRTNSSELVGKTAIYNSSIPSIFAGYLMRVNQISYINASYLNYYLNSPNARKCGKIAKTDGVNQANINGKKLARYPFPLCSDAEQAEIVSAIESRLSVCDKLEQIVAENLAKAQALRQSILKKAFAGELVLQDPNDEPAEKLLERIKAAKATAAILSTSARRKRK